MAPEERKRRKIEQGPSLRVVSSPTPKKTGDKTSSSSLMRNFAVAQAQKEGCTGNYRIFDSPYGNFLVPVIPFRGEVASASLS